MRQKVRVPSVLRKFTGDEAVVEVEASSVRDLLQQLQRRFPDLRPQLLDDSGALRRFINLYVNENDIRALQNLDTPLQDRDEISIIPAIAGG